MQKKWVSIIECKQMGLLIENYYMLITNLAVALMSLLMILLSHWLVDSTTTKSVLIIVCLSMDRDMAVLFLAIIRL